MEMEQIKVSGHTFAVTNGVSVSIREMDRVMAEIVRDDRHYAEIEEQYKTAFMLGLAKGLLYDALSEVIMLKRQIRRLEERVEQQEQEMSELVRGE